MDKDLMKVIMNMEKRLSELEEWTRIEDDVVHFKIKEIYDIMADLSMRINQMKSSLREFEKQKIDPKFEEIARQIDHIVDCLNTD